MNSPRLSLEDINEIIKHFALQIQDRIQELHKKRGIFFISSDPNSSEQSNQLITNILKKYSSYQSSQVIQVKIIKKFTERILQIFNFFKQKYTSHSENLLNVIENRVKSKLQFLVNQQVIPIGQIIQFAFSLTTKNALSSVLKYNSFQKQKYPKQKRSFLSSCQTSIKISLCSEPDQPLKQTQDFQRNKQNQTELSKTQIAKNQLNFQRIKDRQGFSFNQKNNLPQQRPFTSKQNRQRYKRSETSSNQVKIWRKHSVSNKKTDSYLKVVYKDKQNSLYPGELPKRPVQFDKLYVDMNLDKRFIQKMLEKKQFLFKDMQKRNEKISFKMKKQLKRQKCDTQTYSLKQKYNLKFLPSQESAVPLKILTEKNSNILPQKMNKKQSFRNMIYQNHLQKKKKCMDKNNVSQKSINKNQSIGNKQNIFTVE